ncbi:MAG: hypothetical protein N2Z22_06715 [Turneriella sp.]|nr:hypothetical protein [Leptospiraceae bacterium]MCX7633004.1 hypothetical protein [Turneriella sp.]
MISVLRGLVVFYLLILLVLSLLPLTGYYAAVGALPVIAGYLYPHLTGKTQGWIRRGTFLLALLVVLLGFALNFFCTIYTAWRMAEFRKNLDSDKKRISQEVEAVR